MGNSYIQRVICNLGLAVLLGAFAVFILPSDVLAKKKMSEKECLIKLKKWRGDKAIKVDREAVMKARGHCAKGHFKKAKGTINRAAKKMKKAGGKQEVRDAEQKMSERECLSKLEKVIRKTRPDRETAQGARRYCARGDYESAVKVLRTGGKRGVRSAVGAMSEKECLEKLRLNVLMRQSPPERQREARRYCEKGDLSGARKSLRSRKR